jgi:hypothetical protein
MMTSSSASACASRRSRRDWHPPACRAMGVHPLHLIPLEAPGRALGLEALPVRERLRPRMPNESGRTSSGASSPSRSPTPASAPGGSARSSRARSGVAQDLALRHLALPAPARAQHPHPKAEPGRRLPRPLRAEASRAPVRAARRGLPPGRARRPRLLLRRLPLGDEGRGLERCVESGRSLPQIVPCTVSNWAGRLLLQCERSGRRHADPPGRP